jgi:hypothetical protein
VSFETTSLQCACELTRCARARGTTGHGCARQHLFRPPRRQRCPGAGRLRSRNGVLKVDLTIRNYDGADGATRYCYIDGNGNQSPNLRLKPGDLLILHLKNDLRVSDPAAAATATHLHAHMHAAKERRPVREWRHDGDLHQSSFPRFDHSAGLPPGRCCEDLHQSQRSAVRVSVSHSRRRAAWIVLVPSAHSRVQ